MYRREPVIPLFPTTTRSKSPACLGDLHRRVALGHDPLDPVAVESGRGVSENDVTDQLVTDVDQGDLGTERLCQGVMAGRLVGGEGTISGEKSLAVGVLPGGVGGPHDQDVDW